MAMLEVNHLAIQFGGLRAVDGFNVSIEKGQLYGLIGPNGAGKTTIFNLLTGVYKPTEGIIKLDGQDITGKSTIEINKAGIARTFQNIRLFKDIVQRMIRLAVPVSYTLPCNRLFTHTDSPALSCPASSFGI